MTGKGGRTEGDLKQENQTRVWAGSKGRKGGYKRHVSKLASASIMALTPCSLYCSRWPWSLITMCVCVCVRVWETQNSKCIPGTRWYVFVSVEVWYPIRSVHQGFYCVFFQVLLQWRWRTAPHASAFSTQKWTFPSLTALRSNKRCQVSYPLQALSALDFYEHSASCLGDYDYPGFNASGADFRRQLTLRKWSKLSTNWKVFGLIAIPGCVKVPLGKDIESRVYTWNERRRCWK